MALVAPGRACHQKPVVEHHIGSQSSARSGYRHFPPEAGFAGPALGNPIIPIDKDILCVFYQKKKRKLIPSGNSKLKFEIKKSKFCWRGKIWI